MVPYEDPELNRQRQQLEQLNRERVGYSVAWWWWLWVLILIAIVWFGGWGWGGYGGWWWAANRRRTVVVVQPAGSGIAVLNASNKAAFVGQQFDLSNVPVTKKVSNRVFWVGTNNSAPTLLVLTAATGNGAQPSNATEVSNNNHSANTGGAGNDTGSSAYNGNGTAPHQIISAKGTVEKAPEAEQAKREWNLSDSGTKRLENQGAYMQATELQAQP
jgi:hypothetical protein